MDGFSMDVKQMDEQIKCYLPLHFNKLVLELNNF